VEICSSVLLCPVLRISLSSSVIVIVALLTIYRFQWALEEWIIWEQHAISTYETRNKGNTVKYKGKSMHLFSSCSMGVFVESFLAQDSIGNQFFFKNWMIPCI
jgi:hypothetical protein